MRPTASSVWRLRHCQYWARDEVEWRDDVSAAGELGTETHELIAHQVTRGEGPAPDCDPQAAKMAAMAMAWIRDHVDHTPGAEIGWVLRPGRVVPFEVVGRNYGDEPRLMAGAADLVWCDDPGRWHVVDWKTGRRENVQPVHRNDQMRTLALLLDKAAGAGEVEVHLAFLGGDELEHESCVLDELDIAEHEAWLRECERTIPTSSPQPGKHCEYCPARHACPATVQAIEAIADSAKVVRRLPMVTDVSAFESPEHAAEQYALVRAAEALLGQLKAAVVAFADAYGGIPLPGNQVYRRTTRKVEKIDLAANGATAVLASFLGPEWMNAVKISTTKSALHEACRPLAKMRGIPAKHAESDLLSRLRNVGAVSQSMSVTYKEVPATEQALGIPEMP